MSDMIASLHHLHDLQCPYCWQEIEIAIDVAFTEQEHYEDCPLCCRPIHLNVAMDGQGHISVESRSDDH